eukprot:403372088
MATLSGCIDIIVVRQPDGTLKCSPFHVRFGKLKVLKSFDKEVLVQINGEDTPIKMKLGSAGEALFLHLKRGINKNQDNESRSSYFDGQSSSGSSSSRSNDEEQKSGNFASYKSQKSFDSHKYLPQPQTFIRDYQSSNQQSIHPALNQGLKPEDKKMIQEEEKKDYEDDSVNLKLLQMSPETIQKTVEQQVINEYGKENMSPSQLCKKPFEPLNNQPSIDNQDGNLIDDENIDGEVADEDTNFKKIQVRTLRKIKSFSLRSLNKDQRELKKQQSMKQVTQAPQKQEEKYYYEKSIYPTSEQLESFKLKPGINQISYIVQSRIQGKQTVKGRVFLWNYDTKIIISDVDGTITRSDLMGHILPRMGRDWSHQGIARLFNQIKDNGYEILYLTARNIGLAETTRDYLNGILQDSQYKLPDGPIIMSPDRAMKSLKREIIFRKPHVFKIFTLKIIKDLFKHERNPFIGGFGNRDTDAVSYRAVDIDLSNIFIVNPQGEIHHYNSAYKKTYTLLQELVHDMFPRIQTISIQQNISITQQTVRDSQGRQHEETKIQTNKEITTKTTQFVQVHR